MLEIIAIVLGGIGAAGSLGNGAYKCYKIYKNQDESSVTINNISPSQHDYGLEKIILQELNHGKNRDTDVDIKINIHTEVDEGK